MSYFLKISNKKRGKYLQIYDSYHVRGERNNKSKCHQSLGYLDDLRASGIEDPISHYRDYAKELNRERNRRIGDAKARKIGDEQIEFCLGSLILDSLFGQLGLAGLFDAHLSQCRRGYDHSEVFLDLVKARLVDPKSKLATFNDTLPRINPRFRYSLSDVYSCLEDFGSSYQSAIELFNASLSRFYRFDAASFYFDCTNFYFEIDREDALRRKGPSKENRKEPLLGMGLLLDGGCMPVTMRLYPGNESEKPMLKRCVDEAKRQGLAVGRTVRVADKGLNCAKNILDALKEGDGYIFSKSVAKLPQRERAWVDIGDQYEGEYEGGSLVFKSKSCVDDFEYSFTDGDGREARFKAREKRVVYWSKKLADKKLRELDKLEAKVRNLTLSGAKREQYSAYAPYISFRGVDENGEITDRTEVIVNREKLERDRKYAGYNMIVTSEAKLGDRAICDAYHRLWEIEESFRILKTDLDARPVYLQKPNEIYGHFLVCYLSIALIRILQNVVFGKRLKVSEILGFIRRFKAIKIDDDILVNTLRPAPHISVIAEAYSPKIENARLTGKDVEELKKVKLLKRRAR